MQVSEDSGSDSSSGKTPLAAHAQQSGGTSVRECPRCGPVAWAIIRDVDHLAAECPQCRLSYDIGWSTRGYVLDGGPYRV
jgi:hypothetical protein